MEHSPVFINIPGVPAYVTYSWLAMLILISLSLLVRRSLKLVPTGSQNFLEVIVDAMLNLSHENIGHHWGEKFFPLIATIFMYILVCNFMGLIPGFESPSSNINMTASIAIPVFLATHYYGVKVHKVKYFYHFLGPIRSIFALPLMIMMFFIEMIGHLVRPVTLSVRLFGNMFAKHILIGVMLLLAPFAVPSLVLMLGTLVSLIQAFVFTLLASLFLAGTVEEAH